MMLNGDSISSNTERLMIADGSSELKVMMSMIFCEWFIIASEAPSRVNNGQWVCNYGQLWLKIVRGKVTNIHQQ